MENMQNSFIFDRLVPSCLLDHFWNRDCKGVEMASQETKFDFFVLRNYLYCEQAQLPLDIYDDACADARPVMEYIRKFGKERLRNRQQ